MVKYRTIKSKLKYILNEFKFASLNNQLKFDNVILFYFISFAAAFSQGIFSMFAGIYLTEIGYQEAAVGNLLSINTIAIALGSIISAYLIERIGRKRSFYLSCILFSISTVLIMSFKSINIISIFVIINGIGLSIRATAEGLFLSENTTPENRMKAFSNNFIVTFLGMMSASYLGGHMSDYLNGYFSEAKSIFYIALVSTIIALCCLIPISKIKEVKLSRPRTFSECIRGYSVIKKPGIAMYMLYYTLNGIGAGLVVPFFSMYLKYSMSLSESVVGSVLSFSQLGCIVGGFCLPFLSKKLGRHKSAIYCQLLSIPFLISIAFPQGLIVIYISFFIRGGLMNMATPLNTSIFMDLVEPSERSNFSSLMSLFSSFARAIGISLGGYMMQNFSYNTPYYFTVVFYLAGISVFAYATNKTKIIKK